MKLSLNPEQHETLLGILETYDFLCDCPDWPNCRDFKAFQKLTQRVKNLPEHSKSKRHAGWLGNRKRIDNIRQETRESLIKVQNEMSKQQRESGTL